jgi:hypothetical protein
MDYALLIHASEAKFATKSSDEQGALFAAYRDFTKALMGTGKTKPGAALLSSTTATCLRVREGKTILTDGPFAETKEQLAGFYLFSTDDATEAAAWAAKIPDADGGSIEVRAVPTFEMRTPYPEIAPKPASATKEYMLLIYEAESRWTTVSDAERGALMGGYFKASADMREAGVFIDGSALSSVKGARTVRVREGKRVVSDGPFAETKEQLGGYYRIWARDLDEAIAYAKKIPAAETGTIEIRPVMDTTEFQS